MRVALFILSLVGAATFALLLLSAFLTLNLTAMTLAALGLAISLPFPGRMMVAALGGWAPSCVARWASAFPLGQPSRSLPPPTFDLPKRCHRPPSIYRNDDVRAQFHALYDRKMQAWPSPFEDRFLDTQHRTVHVVV
jgi:hypothetical protein